ncbi:MAG TPA: CHAT domain-containing protein [Thermoanaerobaculia bacterium]|nr:CHAT domain-containing protein [Thermoanaerobaculia bacterium]
MAAPEAAYLDSELELSSLQSARFSWSGGDYRGKPALAPELAEQLLALEGEHEAYGLALYEAVFPRDSELRDGLREAIVAAEREKSRLRFRLHLSLDLPDWVHALFWELLTDPDRHLALARSPDTAFSRYLDARRAQGAPAPGRPRLLCVVSAPSDVARYGMAEIRRDEVLKSLEASFGELADAVEVVFLEPPATLGRLRDRLMEKRGFQLLHFFGHGLSRNGVSALVLETEQGQVHPVDEKLLAEVFLGVRELRLVTLVACHGGAPSSGDPFSGLAGRLVQRGVPSVIAMRRAVRISSAHLFTQHLYRHIAQTGRADAAVNEARQQLFLAAPQGIDWSSPVLYSRVSDGRLWLPRTEGPETADAPAGPLVRVSLQRLRRPLPWVPALLALVLLVLGLWPAARAETRFDLRTSQLFFRLAKSSSVVERLDLQEIAATQLAALRLPASFPVPSSWAPGGGGIKGFIVSLAGATRGDGAHLTLHTPPLPAGTGIAVEHQEEASYRLTIAESSQPLRATFQGEVRLQPLGFPATILRLDRPEALVLFPGGRTAVVDVSFARFAADSFTREISIDRLDLLRVIDQQTPETTLFQKESALLGGEVRMPATGRRVRLAQGETLRFAALDGSLTGLRLAADGIHAGFQGRVSRLERVRPGLPPESLMPSVLDLWIAGPARGAVQAASAAVALAVLLFTALDISILSKRKSK